MGFLLEKVLCRSEVVSNLFRFCGTDIHAVAAEYAEIGGNGGSPFLNFDRLYRALADAFEAILALRLFRIDRLSRIHAKHRIASRQPAPRDRPESPDSLRDTSGR